jgi:hypothetical protein
MNKAVRLKGELYGERSFEEIERRHGSAQAQFEAQRASAGSRYSEALAERSSEVEKRHRVVDRKTEQPARELQQSVAELQDLKRDIGNFSTDARLHARSFVNENRLILTMPHEFIDVVGEACDPDSGAGAIRTGNPVIDEFAEKMHAHWQKLLKESIAIMMSGIKERSVEYERISKALSKTLTSLFRVELGICTGRPGFYRPMAQDLRLCGQMLGEQIKELRDQLNHAKLVEAQSERVQTRIITPLQAAEKTKSGIALPADLSTLSDLARASREARPLLDDLARKHQGDAAPGE